MKTTIIEDDNMLIITRGSRQVRLSNDGGTWMGCAYAGNGDVALRALCGKTWKTRAGAERAAMKFFAMMEA